MLMLPRVNGFLLRPQVIILAFLGNAELARDRLDEFSIRMVCSCLAMSEYVFCVARAGDE